MFLGFVNEGLIRQLIAGLAACQSIFVSGVCFGWIVPILVSLRQPDGAVPMTEEQEGWVVAVIEPGSWFSPLLAGALSSRLGRKPVILASAPMYVVSWLMILYLRTPLWLGLARYIQGFAMGLVFTVTPIYLGEIASASARGLITGTFFVFWWLGILLSYTVGPYLNFDAYTWGALALNFPFALTFIFQPESPHFLLARGDQTGARKALKRLRGSDEDDLDREMDEIAAGVEKTSKTFRLADLCATAGSRRALSLLMVANAVRILSGTGVTLVYATEIFQLTASALPISPDHATVALGLVMLAGGLVGSFVSDLVGRRPLVLLSSVGCFLCQLAAGSYYYLRFETDLFVAPYGWVAPVAILLYSCLVSVGLYPVCSSYTSELFSTDARGHASSLSAINIVVCTFLMLSAYTPVKLGVGIYANFYAYAAVSLIGAIYLYFYALETKGKSFAQIMRELEPKSA